MLNQLNPLIVLPFLAWAATQLIKFSLQAIKGQVNWRLLYSSGGMPSAHTATVVALATTTLLFEGYQSPVFGLSVIMAAIVVYDSFGVRRASGDQAISINHLIDQLAVISKRPMNLSKVRQLMGHRPSEVLVGGLIGAATSLVFTTDRWREQLDWLLSPVGQTENYLYLTFFAGLLGGSVIFPWWLNRWAGYKTAALKSLKQAIVALLATISISGLFFSLAQSQSINILNFRVWPLLIMVLSVTIARLIWYKWAAGLITEHHRQTRRVKNKS